MTTSRIPNLAISLSSSFMGYATHAGFMAALSQNGVEPTRLTGSSAGAITGGLLAAGKTHEEVRQILCSAKFRQQWFEWSAFWRVIPVVAMIPPHTGSISGKRMLNFLREQIGDARLEDSKLRMSMVVSNLSRERTEWKTEGEIAPWIIASSAVPGIFATQEIDGEHYWDGGICEPSPCIGFAEAEDVNTILIHRIVHPGDNDFSRWTISNSFSHAYEMSTQQRLAEQREQLEAAGKTVLVVDTHAPRPFIHTSVKKMNLCWEMGFATGEKFVQDHSSLK